MHSRAGEHGNEVKVESIKVHFQYLTYLELFTPIAFLLLFLLFVWLLGYWCCGMHSHARERGERED